MRKNEREDYLPEQLQENCDRYCKYHNIQRYKIEDGRYLVYNVSHRTDFTKLIKRFTIQYKVDIVTLQEIMIKPLKKFDKEGLLNGKE